MGLSEQGFLRVGKHPEADPLPGLFLFRTRRHRWGAPGSALGRKAPGGGGRCAPSALPAVPPSRLLVALLPLGSPPGQVAGEIFPTALGEKAGGQRAESPGLCALRWLLHRGTEGAAEPFWGAGAVGQS